ncbi:hypothetical protein H2O64_20985 [Kordia sp. YSTF-M3]|uniref:Uncharacterized protein n=1 Tax=Kordia aestuariivivens TaxID=2759037 RepID=A0ABR7QF87_9FLAO|nr:hypothetical protein [Kordia aestuariivivens]MBC8757158.1 hypothetical protein [Kordia aestuariivivens]
MRSIVYDNSRNYRKTTRDFILIRAFSFEVSNYLACNFSNYGSIDIDIFTVDDMILTTTSGDPTFF